jgi:hypothetical protein
MGADTQQVLRERRRFTEKQLGEYESMGVIGKQRDEKDA